MKIKTVLISLLFIPFLVFAQDQAVLPNAGLTPESPFYFLDKLGETLREFFTFNPEGKAHLQVTFAAERVAEIKIILETKGVEAKGLEIAQSRLQAHLTNIATVVTEQKSEGKDVSALAKELDDKLETPKSALTDSFKAEKRALETTKDELKSQLKAAHLAGDTAKEEALTQELGKIKAQKELLELKEDDIEEEMETEEEKLEEEMEAQEKAEKAIQEAEETIKEAEEEKQEVLSEANKEGVDLPPTAFAKFDRLLAQAKELFAKENYQGAKQLAEQAEDALEDVDKEIEKLEEEKERKEEQTKGEEERKREQEEKQPKEDKDQNNEEAER